MLFLADRVALVNQAVNAFKAHLPDSSPVNLVTEKDQQGRVFVSTYPTMMGLIDDTKDGQRRFGVGHFDLVVIDEAHRSVYQNTAPSSNISTRCWSGLTATPKDEIDKNTYSLFDLETACRPTPTRSTRPSRRLSGAAGGDLGAAEVPALGHPLRRTVRGREGPVGRAGVGRGRHRPDSVEAASVNKWLFNEDTVDKVLAHLMTSGQKVAGGDRLGKTIVFAKNHDHAEFIEERFNANYPHFNGHFARVITFKTEYAQTLIDDFSKEKHPHIAISVDMLDTGIDVPEVVNLVFFKLVRSKTKFWQMIGRGTRLCPDLFGPGEDKEFFRVFDYCENLEFFSQNLPELKALLGNPLERGCSPLGST